ncbi:hypothetical protein C2E25_11250 [Geothermobacter hydrogeniphilus]|uniref:histidine kinase n=2 Tax=Geothermobacter hydrogeniphilus TaxID=1969733 RepID=A0A2K2H8W3_9BACT|nr:hypothetical protein C2E25_11250 [Geothermobacter hydrogeniphilus]
MEFCMTRQPTLRTALLWRFLLLALLPLVLIGLLTFRTVTHTITDSLEAKNLLLATSLAREVEETLREPQTVLRQLASVMLDYNMARGTVVDGLLDNAVSNASYFEAILLVDPSGKVLHVGLPDSLADRRNDYLGMDLSQMEPVRRAGRTGQVLWSDALLSPPGNHQYLCLVYPFGNRLLVGNLNIAYLGQLSNRERAESSLSFTILDHTGTLILHSRLMPEGRRANLSRLKPVREGLAGHQGTFPFTWQGRDLVGTVVSIPTTGWLVLVSQDVDVAYAASFQVRNSFFIGCLLALGLALGVALAFSNRLVQPLRTLAREAQDIAIGDYQVGIAPQLHQETEELAASFRGMAAEINLRENELLESREHYLRLFNCGNDAVLVFELEEDGTPGRFVEVNDIACEALGFLRTELLTMRPRQVLNVFAEASEQADEVVSRGRRQGHVLFETDLITRTGERLPVELNVRFFDREGKATALAVARDIRERREAEQALRQSEKEHRLLAQQLRTLFDGIPDSLVLYDEQMRILWANRGAAELLRCSEQDLVGQCCHQVLYDRRQSCGDCAVARALASGQLEMGQWERAEGRLLEVRAFPVVNDQGAVIRVIELAQDVTEKLRAQRETIRTGQLVAIGELAAGVAHEINNPINGIINYAQILANHAERGGDSPDLPNRIIKEGNRIAAIVSSLLNFSRSKKEEIMPVPLHEMVNDALTLMKTLLRKDGIEVDVRLPPDLPPVAGRYQQLEQVLINLLSNARHALNSRYDGHHEEKRLEISALEHDSGMVRIMVWDHGVGIPEPLVERILNPFFTTKPAGEGTGLGLSISHGIIREHGGRIDFESKEGEYTRVLIDLPVYSRKDA